MVARQGSVKSNMLRTQPQHRCDTHQHGVESQTTDNRHAAACCVTSKLRVLGNSTPCSTMEKLSVDCGVHSHQSCRTVDKAAVPLLYGCLVTLASTPTLSFCLTSQPCCLTTTTIIQPTHWTTTLAKANQPQKSNRAKNHTACTLTQDIEDLGGELGAHGLYNATNVVRPYSTHNTLQHGMAQRGTAQISTTAYMTALHSADGV